MFSILVEEITQNMDLIWKILNHGKFKSPSLTFTLCSISRISDEAGTIVRACIKIVSWNKTLDCLASLTFEQENWLIVPLFRHNEKKRKGNINKCGKDGTFSPNEDIDLHLQLCKTMAFYLPVGLSLRPMLWSTREEEIWYCKTDLNIQTVPVGQKQKSMSGVS